MRLPATKRLAARNRMIDAFHLDDFSLSMENGVTTQHMASLQHRNALFMAPALTSWGTVYPLSLEDGGRSVLSTRSFYPSSSSGRSTNCRTENRPPWGVLLRPRQLEADHLRTDVTPTARRRGVAADGLITGIEFTGTCMMDLGWESVQCLYDWPVRVGDDQLNNHRA